MAFRDFDVVNRIAENYPGFKPAESEAFYQLYYTDTETHSRQPSQAIMGRYVLTDMYLPQLAITIHLHIINIQHGIYS